MRYILCSTLSPSRRIRTRKIQIKTNSRMMVQTICSFGCLSILQIQISQKTRFVTYDGKFVSIDAWHFGQYNAILFWDKNHCFYLTIACPYLTETYTHILYKEGFRLIGYHISTDPWTVRLDNSQWGNLYYFYCALWLSPLLHL